VLKGNVNQQVKDTKNAYVVFESAGSIKKALKVHNTLLNGKHLRVDSLISAKVQKLFSSLNI
jgi:hypothetical protein